jgi:SAM-dependent methyltransferase
VSAFDDVAELYDAVRPGYPSALFDDLASLTGCSAGDRLLEVGAGTGQATQELARRGYAVVALEPGPRLADLARRRLHAWPNAEVITTRFEDWRSPRRFQLLVSATAFHWVDQSTAYRRAAAALERGGWIALFWHRHVRADETDGFYAEVAEIYRRRAPHLADSFTLPRLEDASGDQHIAESGLFGPVEVRRYGWRDDYDADRYQALLRTYSDHLALSPADLEALLGDLGRLIRERYANRVTLARATVLYVAQVLDLEGAATLTPPGRT